MKKKYSILISFLLTILLVALFVFAKEIKGLLCGSSAITCWETYNLLGILLMFSPVVLVFSVLASEAAFGRWIKITLYFILAYTAIVMLTPWSVGDEFVGFTKGMVGLALCIGYSLFSAVYLLVKKN